MERRLPPRLHALLTGERQGYYADFGGTGALAKALREDVRSTTATTAASAAAATGRRPGGTARATASSSASRTTTRSATAPAATACGDAAPARPSGWPPALLLLSPYVPLLFMGEEYGEAAPFPFFTSHSDPALVEAVRRGRAQEFEAFRWPG